MTARFTTRPLLRGHFGMVASTHWLASSSAMSILERGGNAADAAVTAAFVLQVVEPHLNGPGGEVPIMLWDAARGKASVICGQGTAPGGLSASYIRSLGLGVIPGTGLLPVVVPGAFGAWIQLLSDYGTMPLRTVMEPAIAYARRGYPLPDGADEAIRTVAALFAREWPSSAALWLRDGEAPAAGDLMRNLPWAETMERILGESEAGGGGRLSQLERARRCWYEGFIAEAIVGLMESGPVLDSSGKHHHGVLTAGDLRNWTAGKEDPLTCNYGRYTILKTGPWGQGPVLLQQLALLTQTDIAQTMPGSAEWIHLIVECSKLAFADREAWYGDPKFADVPMHDLLSEVYNRERSALLSGSASYDLRPGSPGGRSADLPVFPIVGESGPGVGEPTIGFSGETRGDTCHLDVVDRWGTMISATPSGGWLQSSPAVPGLGFCLSTRGQMFVLDDGHPNALRPNARPRTTLTPSLAFRDGKPWLAFGTPGGDAQDQWSLQFFLNVVHGGMNFQEAIEAPEFHSTHMPSSFYPRDRHPAGLVVESRIDPEVVSELRKRGHDVTVAGPWSEGRLSAVAREGAWLQAAANPRRSQGYAVGR